MQWAAVHNKDLLLRYLEIIMMHGNFSWVPDNSGDCVTLLQRLVDQVLSSLSCSAEYGYLHRQARPILTSRTLTAKKFPPCSYI